MQRFTRDARSVVIRAQEVARAAHAAEIGCLPLLIALGESQVGPVLADHGLTPAAVRRASDARRPGELDAAALSTLGIDLDAIRGSVEARFGPGALDPPRRRRRPFAAGHLRFSRAAKKALELGLREAVRLRLSQLDAATVLLGVLRSDDVQVTAVLADLGVRRDELRTATESWVRDAAA